MTNIVFNMGCFIFFHWIRGTPFDDTCQGRYRALTLWEQLDNEQQYTPSKKFLAASPIILFLLSVHHTHYDVYTFFLNFASLVIILIAKLPFMHRVRIFGLHKDISHDDGDDDDDDDQDRLHPKES